MPNPTPGLGAVRWGAAALFAIAVAMLPSAVAGGDLHALDAPSTLSSADQTLALTPPPPEPRPLGPPSIREILVGAAQDHGVDPNLFLALSYWESGWRQDRVSDQGAVGLLQVMPNTAAYDGPKLLGRQVNIENPVDNAELGAALLKYLLDDYDTRTALAAYYQGEPALLSGNYAADTWSYADGVIGLAEQIAAGQGPPGP